MCTAAAASCRQIPGANTHPLLQPLSLSFIFKEKRKRQTEIEGKRQELEEQILLLQHSKVSSWSLEPVCYQTCGSHAKEPGRACPGWRRCRGLPQPLFIQSGNHPWAVLVNFSNSGHCYTASQFLKAWWDDRVPVDGFRGVGCASELWWLYIEIGGEFPHGGWGRVPGLYL